MNLLNLLKFLNKPVAKNPTDKNLLNFLYFETCVYLFIILAILVFLFQNSFRVSFEYALNNLFLYFLYFGFYFLPFFILIINLIYCFHFGRRKKTDFLFIFIFRILAILAIFILVILFLFFNYNYNQRILYLITEIGFIAPPIIAFGNLFCNLFQIYKLIK